MTTRKMLFSLFAIIILLLLSGCTLQRTNNIIEKLDINDLYNNFNVKPQMLSSNSKCSAPPTVKIANVESRTEDYEALQNPPFYGMINPKEMMDSVVSYLGKGFEQSGIKTDTKSDKVLQIKMEELKSIAGFWSFGSYCKLQIIIPEKNIQKYFDANDNSGHGYSAAAYAIHNVTRKIIEDQDIQNYILCRDKKEQTTSLSNKLQELKTAFESGLISEKEYQLKRKKILDEL